MSDLNEQQQALVALFQEHVQAELRGDLETTMATMTDNPHLTNVPSMVGGAGQKGVRDFYANHLVSSTVGTNQIVDELVIRFTHTTVIEWMLPDVQPTGKRVEVAFVVVVGIDGGKISHEHIYWDQASVLVQIGLLDPKGLPVSGAEAARRILDPTLPSRPMG
jgi:carboxymethylenebutenolidase